MKKILLFMTSLLSIPMLNFAQPTIVEKPPVQESWKKRVANCAITTAKITSFFAAGLYLAAPRFRYMAIRIHMNHGKTLEEARRIVASQDLSFTESIAFPFLGIFAINLYDEFRDEFTDKFMDELMLDSFPFIKSKIYPKTANPKPEDSTLKVS